MTHPRTGHQAIQWMRDQAHDPSANHWAGLCQSTVRRSLGLPAWAASARIAFERTPDKHLHKVTDPLDVPCGVILYGLTHTTYGHAWLSAHHGHAFSIDYRTRGRISRVPLLLPAWTHGRDVHWTRWTPFGYIKEE